MDCNPVIQQIYGYVDPNGNTLQLRLGYDRKVKLNDPDKKDTGYRWSFVGKKIPMPVWSGDWFKGHPEPVMTEWLKNNGCWCKAFMIDLCNNKTEVYELPKATEDWIPVSTGKYPDAYETVQVTYRSSFDGIPMCNAMVFWTGTCWRWKEGGDCITAEIIAWRPCNPYKATEIES